MANPQLEAMRKRLEEARKREAAAIQREGSLSKKLDGKSSAEQRVLGVSTSIDAFKASSGVSTKVASLLNNISDTINTVAEDRLMREGVEAVLSQINSVRDQINSDSSINEAERTLVMNELRKIEKKVDVGGFSLGASRAASGIGGFLKNFIDPVAIVSKLTGGSMIATGLTRWIVDERRKSKEAKKEQQRVQAEVQLRSATLNREVLENVRNGGDAAPDSIEVGDEIVDEVTQSNEILRDILAANEQFDFDLLRTVAESGDPEFLEGLLDGFEEIMREDGTHSEEVILGMKEELRDQLSQNNELLEQFIQSIELQRDRDREAQLEEDRRNRSGPLPPRPDVIRDPNAEPSEGRGFFGGFFGGTLFSKIGAIFKNIFRSPILLLGGLAGAATGALNFFTTTIPSLITSAFGGVTSVLSSVAGTISSIGSSIVSSLGSLISGAGGIVKKGADAIGGAFNRIPGTLGKVARFGGGAAAVAGAGYAGYQAGTFLNEKFDLSGKINDFIFRKSDAAITTPTPTKPKAPAPEVSKAPTVKKTKAAVMPEKKISDMINEAADRIGVSRSTLMALAAQESGFRPGAAAKTSSAKGLFQFIDGTWSDMVRKYGATHPELFRGPFDPLASAVAGALYTKENQNILLKRGIQPTAANLYAMHFMGAGGGAKLLSLPDEAPAAQFFPSQAKANKSVFFNDPGLMMNPKTVGEVKDGLFGKVGRSADQYAAMSGEVMPTFPTLTPDPVSSVTPGIMSNPQPLSANAGVPLPSTPNVPQIAANETARFSDIIKHSERSQAVMDEVKDGLFGKVGRSADQYAAMSGEVMPTFPTLTPDPVSSVTPGIMSNPQPLSANAGVPLPSTPNVPQIAANETARFSDIIKHSERSQAVMDEVSRVSSMPQPLSANAGVPLPSTPNVPQIAANETARFSDIIKHSERSQAVMDEVSRVSSMPQPLSANAGVPLPSTPNVPQIAANETARFSDIIKHSERSQAVMDEVSRVSSMPQPYEQKAPVGIPRTARSNPIVDAIDANETARFSDIIKHSERSQAVMDEVSRVSSMPQPYEQKAPVGIPRTARSNPIVDAIDAIKLPLPDPRNVARTNLMPASQKPVVVPVPIPSNSGGNSGQMTPPTVLTEVNEPTLKRLSQMNFFSSYTP